MLTTSQQATTMALSSKSTPRRHAQGVTTRSSILHPATPDQGHLSDCLTELNGAKRLVGNQVRHLERPTGPPPPRGPQWSRLPGRLLGDCQNGGLPGGLRYQLALELHR